MSCPSKLVCPSIGAVYTGVMSSRGAHAFAGEIIAGRYRIDAWVGQGNMAMVFRATHLGTGRECALKLVHEHLVERPEIQEMFVQEARVGGRIGKNPYIVDVFDAGIDSERRVPFLAMDLIEGTTLDKYIKHHGQMPPGLLRTLWLQLADALEQAHTKGVVHRDLKPGNLFLTYDRKGNPQMRVVDFGIAKLMEEGVQKTATQIGTPAYAAPEQLGNGMRMLAERMGFTVASAISPATDIWALGVVTYEMLVGAHAGQLWMGPERGAATDLMVLVATGQTPCASARAGARGVLLPSGFDGWLERCLQKNSADRWPSVEVAVQNLVSLFDGGHIKLSTIKLSPAVASAGTRSSLPNTTLRLPMHSEANPPVTDVQGTSSLSETPTGSNSDSNALRAGAARKQERAQLDSLTGSNPPPSDARRMDGTSLGVSETLAPRRAKRARRMGVAIAVMVLSSAVLILVVALLLPQKTSAKKAVDEPILSVASPIPRTTAQSNPSETPAAVDVPQPMNAAPVAAPPTPSLGARLPEPRTSSSANAPHAPVASAAAPMAPIEANATLNINSIPVSKVVLDGRPLGSTPKVGVSVSPGTHTVVFVHPVHGKKTVSITVKAGETKAVPMKFDESKPQ